MPSISGLIDTGISSRLHKAMRTLLVPFLIAGLALVTLCVALSPLGFPFELFSHFTPQIAIAALVLTVIAAMADERQWAFVSAGLAVALCWRALITPEALSPHKGEWQSGAETITLASFNMWVSERAATAFAAYAETEGVDVIALTEVYDIDEAAMLEQFSAWPHHIRVQHSRLMGAGLNRALYVFSNRPFRPDVTAPRLQNGRPFLQVEIETINGPMTIVAVHPYPPYSPGAHADRNETFTKITENMPDHGRYAVMGDLNVTPWSPGFRLLPGRRAGDARLAPTWLTGVPLLGLPLDHIMLGDGLELQFSATGGVAHSDHLPVLAQVIITPTAPQADSE